MEVEVALVPPADDPSKKETEELETADKPREPGSIQTVTVGPGQTVYWKLTSAFKPAEVIVDPDVKVLQMARKLAKAAIP